MITTLIDGSKIVLDTEMDKSLAPCIARDGFWEMWITKVFLNSLRPEHVVFDIGANCGYYALLAAKIAKEVHAFEANPNHCKNIQESFDLNGYSHAHIHPVALSNVPGTLTLRIPDDLTGSASTVNGFIFTDYTETTLNVPAVVLDEYLNTQPDVVIMDVEGAEPYIIPSLLRILKPTSTLFMEFAPHMWDQDHMTFINWFLNDGFTIYQIEHNSTLREVHYNEFKHYPKDGRFYDLCIKRG